MTSKRDIDAESRKLRAQLKRAGLSDQAIDAAWPGWWSDEAAASPSARAELRFTLARLLGLAPKSLIGDRVEFVWKDNARFKHLTAEDEAHRSALTSFCISIGRILLRSSSPSVGLADATPLALRRAILKNRPHVDLSSLLALCWGVGVPVIHLRVFPLVAKSMHAIVVRIDDRYAVLLGKDAQFPAPLAFALAHEVGHVALGHVTNSSVLVDEETTPGVGQKDDEEIAADRFALELLTGEPAPDIRTNIDEYNASQLAEAALRVGPSRGIEPGTLALCLAYRTGNWRVATAALRHIYTEQKPGWYEVNKLALAQLRWDELSDDDGDYLASVMGIANE